MMKRYLADINVWFSLAVEEHQHHASARQWWEETTRLFGFVRTTQLGLLCLLTSSGPMRNRPLSNEQAWAVWDGFLSDERVRVFQELPTLRSDFACFRAARGLPLRSGPTHISRHTPPPTTRRW